MTLYSVDVQFVVSRADVQHVLSQLRQDLAEACPPVDLGGSYRTGNFNVWLTVDAPDTLVAEETGRNLLLAAAARVDGRHEPEPLSVAARRGPEPLSWLDLVSIRATPVLLTANGVELAPA